MNEQWKQLYAQPVPSESNGSLMAYNPKVVEHFINPRNTAVLPEDEVDGVGLVGDEDCGDQLQLWISVRADRIAKIAFKSFGCPGAIATSSALTELVAGKPVAEARCITDDDVVTALGGIPAQKRHCSLLGVRALQAALDDWEAGGQGS